MISKKTITIVVTDRELNALEDILGSESNEVGTLGAQRQLKKLWQKIVVACDLPRMYPMSKQQRLDLQREKRYANPQVFKSGSYPFSYYLHQLEIGEVHFIARGDWTSRVSPSRSLRQLKKATEKGFVINRKSDGSGWLVKREY